MRQSIVTLMSNGGRAGSGSRGKVGVLAGHDLDVMSAACYY